VDEARIEGAALGHRDEELHALLLDGGLVHDLDL